MSSTGTDYWANLQRQRITRRRALVGIGALGTAASLSLIGCGSDSGGGGSSGTKGLGAVRPSEGAKGLFDVPQATRGGIFVRNQNEPSTGWDPHATISTDTGNAVEPISAKLTRHDYRLTPPYKEGNEEAVMGEIAEDWEQPDPLTTIFHIRPNFKWPDQEPMKGRLITAQDVEYSFKRAMAPESVVQAYVYDPIESAKAIDDKTFQIKLKKPQWRFTFDLDSYNSMIIPQGYVEHFKGEIKTADRARGAGPWLVEEHTPGVIIRYKPNPNYQSIFGIPYFDELRGRIFADTAAQLEAFRAKQIFQFGIGAGQLESLRAARPDMKTRLDRYAATSTNPLFFNMRKPQFQDVRLRRAFSVATDREGWGKTGGFGYKLESGPVTWVNPDWKYDSATMPTEQKQWLAFDPQKGKQLLAATGFVDGSELEMGYYAYSNSYHSWATLMVDWYSKIGVKIKLKPYEYTLWIATAYQGDYNELLGPCADNLDRLTSMQYDRFSATSNRNHANLNDPTMTKLLDDFAAATDLQKAKDISFQIQLRSVDQTYAVYNPQPEGPVAWDPRLNNHEGHSPFNYHTGYKAAFMWFSA